MQEVFRTQNIVEIAWVKHRLTEADILFHIFGEHMSAISGGAFGLDAAGCRIMVSEEDYEEACAIISEGGYSPYEP